LFTLDVKTKKWYHKLIKSFKCKYTKKLYNAEFVRQFSSFGKQARKRLLVLDAAEDMKALTMLPSNHLEALGGDREGQYSIRINMQWRICFKWDDAPYDVEIIDYH